MSLPDLTQFRIPLPYYLKLTEKMRLAGERAEASAKEDGCGSVNVLKGVFFEAAVQVWLDEHYEKATLTPNEELRPCPFCHRNDNLVINAYGIEDIGESPEDRPHAVCCDSCGCQGTEIPTRKAAIAAWNTRPEVDRLQKLATHWIHNHGCEVERARVLKERIDMPLDRVKAYDQIGEMKRRIADLEQQIELMNRSSK